MKKGILLIIFIVSLFIVACQPGPEAGETPLETEAALQIVKTGKQGVETRLMPNYPPSLIYDDNELIAIVELENKGNYDLSLQECFVQITGFDNRIISGGFGRVQSCATNLGDILEGKNFCEAIIEDSKLSIINIVMMLRDNTPYNISYRSLNI